MERLLRDADALSDSFNLAEDENGNLVYSYADIVDAIHIVQTEMGITGTTAKEASSTISGSVSTMKAAWQNLSVAIADENGNVEESAETFADTLATALDNILPKVEKSFDSILIVAEQLIPEIGNRLPGLLQRLVPNLVTTAFGIIKSLAQSIKNNAGQIVDAAKDIIFSFIDGIVDALPDVLDAFSELVAEVVEAIPDIFSKIADAFPKIVDSLAKGITDGSVKVVRAVASWFTDIPDIAGDAMEQLNRSFENFVSFGDQIQDAARNRVSDLSNSLSDKGKTLSQIDEEIKTAEDEITRILGEALATQQGLRDEDIRKIEEYNEKIRQLEQDKLSIYRDQQIAEFRTAQFGLPTADTTDLAVFVGEAQAAFEAANDAVNKIFNQQAISLENYYKTQGLLGSKAHMDAVAELEAQRAEELAINQQYYNDTLNLVSARSAELAQSTISDFETVGQQAQWWKDYIAKLDEEYYFGVGDATKYIEMNEEVLKLVSDDFAQRVADYINALNELDIATSNAFITSAVELKSNTGVIDKATKDAIQTILDNFQELPGELGEATHTALMNVVDGLSDTIPQLKNASSMSVTEIKNVITQYLSGTAGYSAGSNYVGGITSGIVAGTPAAVAAAQSAAAAVQNATRRVPKGYVAFGVDVDGSHAGGLDYVPFDGYIAELHKGEKVLPANEAAKNSCSTYNISINISGAEYDDPNELANIVARKIQKMTDRRGAAYA